jgi:hypothetical protein
MRKTSLLKVFVVLVLCVVALGFYRGWFVLSSQSGGGGGNQVDVNLTVDPDKAKEDVMAVEEKARGLATKAGEETTEPASEPDK